MRQQPAGDELQELLSIVAHDLRHPLVSIRGLLGLLQEDTDELLDPAARENLALCLSECRRMERLLCELGDLARIEQSEPRCEAISPRRLIERRVEQLRARLDPQQVRFEIDADERPVALPALQVEEVLDNVLDNAVKYGCPDGCGTVRVRAVVEEGRCVIAVADSGPGIPRRHRRTIFGLFKRLAGDGGPEGTGVGLTAGRRILRRLGGELDLVAESRPGATFRIRFPVGGAA